MMETLQSHLESGRAFRREQLGKLPWILGAVFAAVALFTFVGCMSDRETTALIVQTIQEMFLSGGVVDETGTISFFGILLNNWFAMVFCVLYGFLPYLYLPVLAIISNGALLGVLAAWYVIQDVPLTVYAVGILPHGVFELPALFLAAACGFALCRNIIRRITKNPRSLPMVEFLIGLLQTMLLVIFPLVLVAAAIETWVTPVLMSLFL